MHPSYANSRVSGKFNPQVQRVPSTQLSSFRLSLARYSQSVTRNNTSSGTVVLHRNSIHKSREPITNIPSIRMREGEEDAKLYRGRRRENSALETILRWRAQHNAYAPMSSLSMVLTNYPPFGGRCDVTECNGSWCRWLCETSDIIFWLVHQLLGLVHSLWDAVSWVQRSTLVSVQSWWWWWWCGRETLLLSRHRCTISLLCSVLLSSSPTPSSSNNFSAQMKSVQLYPTTHQMHSALWWWWVGVISSYQIAIAHSPHLFPLMCRSHFLAPSYLHSHNLYFATLVLLT